MDINEIRRRRFYREKARRMERGMSEEEADAYARDVSGYDGEAQAPREEVHTPGSGDGKDDGITIQERKEKTSNFEIDERGGNIEVVEDDSDSVNMVEPPYEARQRRFFREKARCMARGMEEPEADAFARDVSGFHPEKKSDLSVKERRALREHGRALHRGCSETDARMLAAEVANMNFGEMLLFFDQL